MINIKIEKGDITTYEIDAIVNAANTSLLGGSGVDGAIHRKAGPQLLEACKTLKGCQVGEAKITKGYGLPVKYVIHTVGPKITGIYGPSDEEIKDLYNAWYNTLNLADENQIKTIAFPSISTGCYSFPLKLSPSIVEQAIENYNRHNKYIKDVIIVCYDDYTLSFYQDWFSYDRELTERVVIGGNRTKDEYTIKINEFTKLIHNADNITFIGGAGISTESGIPDFRGEAGLYNKENNYKYSPRKMLSKGFFYTHKREFYNFYRSLMPKFEIQPNKAHFILAELEKQKNLTIITQNIDGLHERAGSRNVINLHGTAIRNHCQLCRAKYTQGEMQQLLMESDKGIPKCKRCQIGAVRPDTILYDEMINPKLLIDAKKAINAAELVIVGGTTLLVNPTRSLLKKYNGKIVIINKGETTLDSRAEILFNNEIGMVLEDVADKSLLF